MTPLGDPWTAPPRTDLPWLRHRSLRKAPAPPPEEHTIDVRHHQAAPAPARTTPAPDSSLDLGSPPPPAARTSPASPSTSLDLSTPPPATTRPVITPPSTPRPRLPAALRTTPGRATILGAEQRTVTLDRLQSGIGALTVEAACSAEVGDLRLGCAWQLSTGESSTVMLDGGARFGPRDAKRPVLVMSHDRFETLGIDLRQLMLVERLGLFALSHTGQPLRWGGTLVVTTFGGARVEVPLDHASGAVAMLLTAYNVRGELVLRAELEAGAATVRDLCKAYGFDRISWLDDKTPVS